MIERIAEIVDSINGTPKSLNECCEDLNIDEDSLTLEELEQLDNEVFCCSSCGWWYDLGDEGHPVDGERVCRECEDN